MKQLKPVLSDAEIEKGRKEVFSTENPYCPCGPKMMRKAARWAEQAVLTKLPEQEPVAVVGSGFQLMYRGGAAISEIEGLKVGMMLYAHPCVPENGENDRQLARDQPCGCIICRCASEGHCFGCGAKSCGAHEIGEIPNPVYVDHIADASKMVFDPDAALTLAERTLNIEITEPIADEIVQFARKLHEKYTQADHIPDASKMIPDGWQLVPIEPTYDMTENAHNCDSYFEVRNIYKVMLAAAPKYTGDK